MAFVKKHHIYKRFGSGENRVGALRGPDMEIEKGQLCVLLGPSGFGKSTLLNILGGIETADEGYVSVDGEKIVGLPDDARHYLQRKKSFAAGILFLPVV